MRRIIAAFVIALVSVAPAHAQDVIGAIRARDWGRADAAASAYADPVVRKLVLFYRMLTPHAARLSEYEAFFADSPDWPLQAGLANRRDDALAAEPDDSLVITACAARPPNAAPALARCAQASLQQANAESAHRFARAAWIAAAPNPDWEAEFLRGWGPDIGADEDWRRFLRLAWSDPTDAPRVLPRLTGADQLAAMAWLALRHDDPNGADLAETVPTPRHDEPLLVLEHLRWLRRANRDPDALALWQKAGLAAERDADPHRAAFWDERNILARHRLRDGDPAGAYDLVASTAQTAPEQIADAAFLAGWIALRPLADPTRAHARFTALAQVSTAALTQSRAQYWLGRTAQAAGDSAAARTAFTAAAAYAGTFYGQLATGDGATLAARITSSRDPAWDRTQALAFAGRELARAAAWLVAWNEPQRASSFLLRLAEVARDPADLSLAAHLATGFGMTDTAVTLARRAGRLGVVLLEAGWPVAAAIPADAGVDAALALGIIRQESSFDSATISPVGARGLMQLMPATATQISRALGQPGPSATALVADPALNIRLGTAYLRSMLSRFDTATPLAVAAYNAGPNRVDQWLGSNGDPRTGQPDMIDWIELIPFSETRNYVQRVLENTVVYRAKLGETPENPLGKWPHSPA